MQPETLAIFDLVGPYCVTERSGNLVREQISKALKGTGVAFLDFQGVKVYSSPFFNASIGAMLAELSAKELEERVVCVNLDANGREVLNRVIDNAVQKSRDPKYGDAIERAFKIYAE